MKREIIITSSGFVIGLAEALIYFNLGKGSGKKFTYKIPPTKELLQTAGIVMVTSVLTAFLTKGIEKVAKPKEKEQLASLDN